MKERVILLMELYTLHELATMLDEKMTILDNIRYEHGESYIPQLGDGD